MILEYDIIYWKRESWSFQYHRTWLRIWNSWGSHVFDDKKYWLIAEANIFMIALKWWVIVIVSQRCSNTSPQREELLILNCWRQFGTRSNSITWDYPENSSNRMTLNFHEDIEEILKIRVRELFKATTPSEKWRISIWYTRTDTTDLKCPWSKWERWFWKSFITIFM